MAGKEMTELEEAQLIEGMRRGDVVSFHRLYDYYFPILFSYTMQFTKSRHDAEDIVQEVFARLWNSHRDVREERSLRAYLFVITKNHLVSAFRRTVRAPMFEDYLEYCNTLAAGEDNGVEFNEFCEAVERNLNMLPEGQRRVVRMAKMEDVPIKEIARRLGINEQSVRNHLARGLKTLRKTLGRLMGILVFGL